MVERAVDVPEAEEFGAIDFEFRDAGQRAGQRGPASQRGEPEKKGYVGCSVTCPYCHYAAKFHSYQQRRVLTVHGEVQVQRAYYYCGRCKQSFLPYDEVLGLVDEISPGLMPLVCLAGTLLPFADAAEDVLKRFAGVRLSASTVLRCTEGEGERLRAQQKEGRMVEPTQPEPKWKAPREEGQPVAYVGLDAFSVPMQGIGAGKAEHRMLYTALLYTPEKEHTRYLVDFELDALAEQVRSQARALGIAQVSDLIAVTDGGNGLEEALQRHLAENLHDDSGLVSCRRTPLRLREGVARPTTRRRARSGRPRPRTSSTSKGAKRC